MSLRSPSKDSRLAALARIPSAATLIIVPDVLLDYWKRQLLQHAHTDCLGSVYVDEVRRTPLPPASTLAATSIVIIPHR